MADGAKVVITARKADALAEAAASLGDGNAAWVAGHADDEAHQDETVAKALEEFGRLDMLVNNTGINPVYGRMVDVDLGAAEKIFRVNVLSAVAWTQKAYHAALKDGRGGRSSTSPRSVASSRHPTSACTGRPRPPSST